MLHERLQPLADTATEVIWRGENCIVAYGHMLSAGMGVRFEIVAGSTTYGVGMRLVDVVGKMEAAAAYAADDLKKKLVDDKWSALVDEIDTAGDALAAWVPFNQFAKASLN